MNEKSFEKINIKIKTRIWYSNSVPNFIQSEEPQIWRPNLRQKYE